MNTKRHIFIFVSILFFSLPITVSAASISFEVSPKQVGVGDVVRVDVLLESAIPTNAFSGTVFFKNSSLEPIATHDGNSLVSMWVTRPVIDKENSSIQFAGITPGGFSGNKGMLFSILLRATKAGTASISLKEAQVLRNDGSGGEEYVLMKPLTLSIDSKSLGGYTEVSDTTPPEPFSLYLGTDSQLFDGQKYVVFTAVDKMSGVDHYAVVESRFPRFLFQLFKPVWHTASSPYTLSDQRLVSSIYVKAVDRAGNEQVSIYPPSSLLTAYESRVALGILVAVAFLLQKRMWRKSRKNS